MKKGIKIFCKVLSVFLAILFVIEILPLQVMAAEFTDAVAQKEFIEDFVNNPTDAEKDAEAEILYEVEEKRDEHTKVYKKSNGTYTAVMTEEPLHYLDEGVWKEINNSMILNGSIYTNLNNLFNVELPKNIDEDKELTVEKDGFELSFSVDNIENSSAIVENNIVASDTEIESADKAISQTQSSVKYSDIADNTDLQYIVTPNSIKENIIVSNKESVKDTYAFTFETNGLNAEKLDDGSILFKNNNGDVKFNIPRPVMTDANFEFSYDIDVSLTENANGTVTLEYAPSADWTSSNNRVYPIIIDPAIVVTNEEPDFIEDVSVAYTSDEPEAGYKYDENVSAASVTNMYALENDDGTTTTVDSEVYTKINTDFFKNLGNDIVFTEVQYILAGATSANGNLFARKITDEWNTNINTKLGLSSEVIDYYTSPLPENGTYDNISLIHFNITEIFNDWFNGETNNGFAITAAENTIAVLLINGGSQNTIMIMDYVDLGGYNENLNYHSQSAGRAGTGYVNDFTQHLSVVRDDLSIDGNIMPVTVGMIYDTATYAKAEALNYNNILAYGNNWIPNYLRAFLIGEEDQFTYYTDTGASIDYTYTIENGEVVFKEIYSDIYGEHEYKLEYFPPIGNQPEYVTMTRPDGYVERFNSDGLLVSVTNPDYPEQTINVVYDSMGRINYVTDGVNRKYDYIYDNTTNLLLKVKCCSADENNTAITAGTTNSLLEVSYAYDSNKNLTSVTFPDGKTARYTYDSNGNITSMTNIDGYRVKYDYDSNDRITKITEQANNGTDYVDGNFLTYERLSSTQIKLTDGTGNFEFYQFGKSGNLLYTVDSFGNYVMNENSGSTENTYFIPSSDYRVNSENLLLNPSFETEYSALNTSRAKHWESSNSAFERTTLTDAYFGEYVYKASRNTTGDAYQKQTIDVLSGGKYTFSAYVKSDDTNEGKLYVDISARNGSNKVVASDYVTVEDTNGEWQRYSVTIDASGSIKDIIVKFGFEDSKGTFYVDNVQLSQSASASPYNYITDGGFRNNLDYWTGSGNFETVKSTINGEVANAVVIPGGVNTENTISQTVTINGKKDDVFTVGGWLKGCFVNSATNNSYLLDIIAESSDPKICNFTDDRYAQIEVAYQYTEIIDEGTAEEQTITHKEEFAIPFVENIEDWQFAAQDFVLKGDCETITVLIRYSKNANSALISNIELSKDEDAVIIDEDEETTEETSCVCEDCEEADCTCACASEALCNCAPCKRRSDISTTDSFGNITSSSSFDGIKTIKAISKYTTDGNYLTSETDADGNEVFYSYNTLNGILTAITDANGNTTSYSYDANGMLTQVSVDNSSANYVYNNDRLAKIVHNDFAYGLYYDIWGQLTSVAIEKMVINEEGKTEFVLDKTIISYEYGELQFRDRILSSIYYNADGAETETEYTYDDELGNIISIDVNGDTKFEYDYDSFGNVTEITASDSRTIRYTDGRTDILDTSDNLIYSSYTNDDGDFIETIGGVTYTSKSYDSSYNSTTGVTTEKSDVTATNGKVIGTVAQQDWFGRYTESIIKTESADDKNTENSYASVKTEYGYPEYTSSENTDIKTSNRVDEYVNKVYYGTDSEGTDYKSYSHYSYEYDGNGNITAEYSLNASGTPSLRYSYVYDELNQLVRTNDAVAQKTYTYVYDTAGNILSKKEYSYTAEDTITTEPNNVINYTYDSVWKDKLDSFGNTAITYDNIGNPLTIGDKSFTWSGRQLETYTQGNKTIEFEYDENGLRHRKTVKENGVIIERYDYVWSDGTLISQTYSTYSNGVLDSTNSAKFIYDAWGTLQGFVLNDTATYLYTKNLQGDILSIVNESGQTIVTYEYDSWGAVSFSATSMQNMMLAYTLSFVSPFTYRGYCYDYDIELYYLQSRYYSAEIGRFINTDDTQIAIATQGEVLGANLFAYCNNNPIVNIDKTGYFSFISVKNSIQSLLSRINVFGFYNAYKKIKNYIKYGHIYIPTWVISSVIDSIIFIISKPVGISMIGILKMVVAYFKSHSKEFKKFVFNYIVKYLKDFFADFYVNFAKYIAKRFAVKLSIKLTGGLLGSLLTSKWPFYDWLSAFSSFGSFVAFVFDWCDGYLNGKISLRYARI